MRSPEDIFLEKLAHLGLPRTASSPPTQLLGRQAARRFLAGEAPSLTSAVAEISDEHGLEPEHVRRLVEHANQETWAAKFHEQSDRHAQFAPANADDVLGALNKAPDEMGMPSTDYWADVPAAQRAPEKSLEDIFGIAVPEQAKVAGAKTTWRDVARIEGEEDRTRGAVDKLSLAIISTGEDLYSMVKSAYVGEGRGILQIGTAIIEACESEEFGSLLVNQIAQRMEREGLVRYTAEQEQEKLAEVLEVDAEHPLLACARGLETMSSTYYRLQGSLEDARARLASARKAHLQGSL